MDRPISKPSRSDHLICRTGWSFLLAIACAFFAYRTFADLQAHDYQLQHNWWNVLTWLVWAALAAGLISEVRCWRERILFGVLFAQFLLGCAFSLWASPRFDLLTEARQSALALWCAGTLLAVVTLVSPRAEGSGN